MDNTLELIAIFVAIVGGFKALEWVIQKITNQHDKAQKIDTNADSLEEYKKKTDEAIKEINEKIEKGHKYATAFSNDFESKFQKALDEQKAEYMRNLKADKEEYIEGIKRVENAITEMQAVYQQTVAIVDIKIESLTKEVEKHNSVIDRTYELEKQVGILDNREKVSEHRLDDLENKK